MGYVVQQWVGRRLKHARTQKASSILHQEWRRYPPRVARPLRPRRHPHLSLLLLPILPPPALHFNRIELFYISDRSVTSGVRIPPLHNPTPLHLYPPPPWSSASPFCSPGSIVLALGGRGLVLVLVASQTQSGAVDAQLHHPPQSDLLPEPRALPTYIHTHMQTYPGEVRKLPWEGLLVLVS